MERFFREELLDRPGQPPEDIAASLRDVRTINRLLLGAAVTRDHLVRLIRRLPESIPLSVLDIATGSGDIPRSGGPAR